MDLQMVKMRFYFSGKRARLLFFIVVPIFFLAFVVPTTIEDFFFPGSQPGESGNLESPDKCQVCHGDYNIDLKFTGKLSIR